MRRVTSGTVRGALWIARAVACVATIAAASAPAMAQSTGSGAAQGSPSQGTVTRIESGFVAAPDVRFTELNNRSATLAGVYGGWMTEHTVLIGAGGYWLTDDSRDRDLWYFGPVVEWLVRGDRRIAFGGRGLVGGGVGRAGGTYGEFFGTPQSFASFGRHGGRVNGSRGFTTASPVIVEDDFFVAEPHAVVSVRATRWLRIDAGAGYRFIAGSGSLNDRFSGASGTVSVQFGGG